MKSYLPKVLYAFLLVGFGYWVGRAYSPVNEELARKKEFVAELEAHELAEYRTLKDQSEKLKKADEILEKIMSVFLVDLGHRFKKVEETPAVVLPKAREEVTPTVTPIAEATAPSSASPTNAAAPGAGRATKASAADMSALMSDNWESALKKHVRSDFGNVLNHSFRPAKDDALFMGLNGKYSGPVTLINPAMIWQLAFEVKGKPTATGYRGNANTTLTKNGKRVAWRREQTTISMLRKSAPDSPWLILEISEEYYAELLFRENSRSFIGNFYEKKGPDNYLHRGTVELHPTEN